MSERKKRGGDRAAEVPLVQWIVAGVALVVVLASFGLIAYEGFGRQQMPASFRVHVDSIAAGSSAYHVHVRVVNEGGSPAADVEVSAKLEADAASPAVLRFDYLPAGSEARGVFAFRADPRTAGLQIEVQGYREP